MSNGRPRHNKKGSLVAFITKELQKSNINELSTDGQNVLALLTLFVDIEYRNSYGKSLDWKEGKGYKMNKNEVLADQLPPVDTDGSARLSSTGGHCL